MTTGRPFTGVTSAAHLVPIFDSVAAHLAAKLEAFQSDERTLTDELCDMSCIWLQHPPVPPRASPVALPAGTFRVTIAKTTPAAERMNGADLEVRISTPLGTKRALFQAKVAGTSPHVLRTDTPAAWRALRRQLISMRKEVGELSFLLLYIPASELDGVHHGFHTYEQAFLSLGSAGISSRFGACIVPVDELLTPSGAWRRRGLRHQSHWAAVPRVTFPLSRVLLNLLSCRLGRWSQEESAARGPLPIHNHGLVIGVQGPTPGEWEEITSAIRNHLDLIQEDWWRHTAHE